MKITLANRSPLHQNTLCCGRREHLQRFQSLCLYDKTAHSILLYGSQGIGKTTFLEHARNAIAPQITFIKINLQISARASSTADVLLPIADQIALASGITQPDDELIKQQPFLAIERYLQQVIAQQGRLILALDEYEALWLLMAKGILGSDWIDFLKRLATDPAIALVLAGCHTLAELPPFVPLIPLFNSIRLSCLSREGVADCIAQTPSEQPLAFNPSAIQRIHQLSNGQPRLVQLLGQALAQQSVRTVTWQHVDAVLKDDTLLRQATYLFAGIWQQAAKHEHHQLILKALATDANGLDFLALQDITEIPTSDLIQALENLKLHDAIQQQEDTFKIAIPLFVDWLQMRKLLP